MELGNALPTQEVKKFKRKTYLRYCHADNAI
jgi:hypothetical protein